jgi:hypothetical protein
LSADLFNYFAIQIQSMQTPELSSEMADLEEKLKYHQKLLDKAFSDKLQFAETKVIFHEMKKIADKLTAIKNQVSEL